MTCRPEREVRSARQRGSGQWDFRVIVIIKSDGVPGNTAMILVHGQWRSPLSPLHNQAAPSLAAPGDGYYFWYRCPEMEAGFKTGNSRVTRLEAVVVGGDHAQNGCVGRQWNAST
ncbi:hypothetical protein PspLS_00790 [Pyricularia sp. CBS 133598]|nr:hypothetical protein PspLS_00790 [Pyricularia sp. CBS 133598]